MNVVELSKENPERNRDTIEHAATVLEDGGVILAPTETVYGIMTLWDNEEGRKRIFSMKARDRSKPLQMLARDLRQVQQAGAKEAPALRALADTFWPGPLTIVCATTDGGSIGARVPDSEFAGALLERVGKPLAASSANHSGQPTPFTARDAAQSLEELPDLVIENDEPLEKEASTVVSLLDYDPEILRGGDIHRDQIVEALRRHGLRK